MMKLDWKLRLGLWLIRRSGYEASVLAVRADLLDSARSAIAEAERAAGAVGSKVSGEWKRSQALRVLLNRHPGLPEHDAANAIQVAVSEARSA